MGGSGSKAGSAGVSPATSRKAPMPRSRGYLPHCDQSGMVQMITFRLGDALPTDRLAGLRQDPKKPDDAEQRRRLEELMDASYGACHLRDPRIARLVEEALWHFDGTLYRLLAWVVMPNHVHALIEPLAGSSLNRIVHSWKSFTAKEANQHLELAGRFWQPEYFDRAIRDERHFGCAVQYIHMNPVKAGLVQNAEDWPYSSAGKEIVEPGAGETPALPGRTTPTSTHDVVRQPSARSRT